MAARLFPTFARWLEPLRELRLPTWRLRGPSWYIATWFGDSLSTQQQSLLRVLSVAHRERLELAPLVQSLAYEHRGHYRRKLRRLSNRLAAGTPLVESLEQTPDALDDNAVLALRFGSQSGTLQPTFEMLLESKTNADKNVNPTEKHFWVYWLVLAITIVLLLTFMMVIITPTFKKMFSEFGLRLPQPLVLLIAIYEYFAAYVVFWSLLAVVVIGVYFSSTARRFFRRTIMPRFVRPVAQSRTAEILKLLAIGVDSGRPLSGALSTLARYHFDASVRQRFLFARNEIEQGVDTWKCLTDVKLLTPQQASALDAAPTNEIRSWTLRRLAISKQDAAARRTSLSITLLQPIMTLVFGAIVMFIFVSYFLVLISMITSLA